MNEAEHHVLKSVTAKSVRENTVFSNCLDGFSEEEVVNFLRRGATNGEFSELLASPTLNQYQRAVLSSQFTSADLRANPLLDVEHASNLNYSIKILEPKSWRLCDTSEPRLSYALENQLVIIVEPGLAVKFHGRLSGLCFKSFATRGGAFIEGNWYSPVDSNLRQEITENFDIGNRRVVIPEGQWSLMKMYNPGSSMVKSRINEIPGQVPATPGVKDFETWKSFRLKLKEEYPGESPTS